MSLLALFLILATHSANVGGQILMKAATGTENRPRRFTGFVGAIGLMTLSFFLTIGLLQRFDLSYLYPFQACSVILMALGTRVFLGERLGRRNLVAMLVITAGVALVSAS